MQRKQIVLTSQAERYTIFKSNKLAKSLSKDPWICLLKDIIALLEAWAPHATAEDFDNVGLLVEVENRMYRSSLLWTP